MILRNFDQPAFRFYGGVFLITASTLMLQIIQTRILSVMTWYHLAFLVISISMFGMTAGAVWVYLRRSRYTEATLSYDLTFYSLAFALATACSLVVQMVLPIHATERFAALIWIALMLCMALPFFCSGVVVSLALTRSPYPIGRVYGIDLVGAALGCLGVLAVLDATDAPSAVLWISAVCALGAKLFAGSGIGVPRTDTRFLARPMTSLGLVALVLASCAAGNDFLGAPIRPLFVKGDIDFGPGRAKFIEWNSFSRIAVYPTHPVPFLWGPSPLFDGREWPIEQRYLNIDGEAGTVTYRIEGDLERVGFLRFDVTNLAYVLPGRDSGAVIGVGGGRDMLSARYFGLSDVVGIEINPIISRLLTSEPGYADFAGLNQLEGLTFEVDEARSWFARTDKRFDIVQMSLIDTWAATGAGAFTLSENGLYTVEAWRIFFEHLTDRGVFTVSRWYAPSRINESGRTVSLAMAAALDMGLAEPRRHIFVAASEIVANLLFSRSPFSAEDLQTLRDEAKEKGFQILISPDQQPATETLRGILASTTRAELERYTAGLDTDLSPSTDDRPFFFNQLPLSNLAKTIAVFQSTRERGVLTGNVSGVITLVTLFLLSALLVLLAIVLPLFPAVRDVGKRLAFGGTVYFTLIGVGFMCAEIGLLQRLSVFLGHPIYSLSIVLFSIILTTGLGSLVSDRFPLDGKRKFGIWSVLTCAYLFALPIWLPDLINQFDGATLLVRGLLCVLVITPAGFLMGFGFPTGMKLVGAVDRRPTPWFWGINGAAGVLASSLAVACSIAYGISVTFVVAAVCYLLLIPAAITLGLAGSRA